MLDNKPNQPSKFRTKNRIKVNNDSRGTYNTNSLIKFKTSVLESLSCDYSDAYITVKGNISVAALVAGGGNNNKEVMFKNCTLFTDCTSEINNAQVDNAKT